MDGRPEPRTRSRQTKLRRGPSSAFCLVEQGYGICGARDEPAHAGQQQQLVDQLGHDSPPPGVAPAKPQLGAGTLVPRRHADLHRGCGRMHRHSATSRRARPRWRHSGRVGGGSERPGVSGWWGPPTIVIRTANIPINPAGIDNGARALVVLRWPMVRIRSRGSPITVK
jgi:hypothetical protein